MSASEPEATRIGRSAQVVRLRKHEVAPERGNVRAMTPEGIATLLELRDRVEARLAAERDILA